MLDSSMRHPLRRPIEVVAGLILAEQKLLICQRHRNAAFPLKWEFPGGKVEAGESAESALVRELKEELDIAISELNFIHRCNHTYVNGPDVSLSFYRVIDYQGVIKNLVFEQIIWSNLADLTQFDFLEGDISLVHQLANGELSAQLAAIKN